MIDGARGGPASTGQPAAAGRRRLLGCVGVGALGAATFGPAVNRRLAPRMVYAAAWLVIAAAALVLADLESNEIVIVSGA